MKVPGVIRRQDYGGGVEPGGDLEYLQRGCAEIHGHERCAQGPAREQQRQAVGPVARQGENYLIPLNTCVGESGKKLPMEGPEIRSRQTIVQCRKVNQDTSRVASADFGESFDDRVQLSQCCLPRVRQDGEQVYCNA